MAHTDTLRPGAPQMGGFLPDAEHIGYIDARTLTTNRIRPRSVALPHTPQIVQWWQDCVPNSVADAYLFELVAAGLVPDVAKLFTDPAHYETWLPSRRKLYWDARAIMKAERGDGGTTPSAVMHAVYEYGVCAERWCPYDGAPEDNPLADHDEAGRMAMDQAGHVELFECTDFDSVLDVLATGHRVLFAAPVFESMQNVGPGEMYEPEGKRLGLHMWQLVGFEEGGGVVRMKNQWPGWGDENQEAFATRATLEGAMITALAFARTARFSEVSR